MTLNHLPLDHAMLPEQHNIESFLRTDLALGLANIRAHLTRASHAELGDCFLSKEGASTIIAGLMALERRADALAERMCGARPAVLGVTETLHRFMLHKVA